MKLKPEYLYILSAISTLATFITLAFVHIFEIALLFLLIAIYLYVVAEIRRTNEELQYKLKEIKRYIEKLKQIETEVKIINDRVIRLIDVIDEETRQLNVISNKVNKLFEEKQ